MRRHTKHCEPGCARCLVIEAAAWTVLVSQVLKGLGFMAGWLG